GIRRQALAAECGLGQPPLPQPRLAIAHDEIDPHQPPEEAILPAANIVLRPLVQDPAHVIGMKEKVDNERPEPYAEYIAMTLLRLAEEVERIAKDRAAPPEGQRNPEVHSRR